MKIKKSIKKAFIVAAWLVVGSGMLTLLIAANQKQQQHVCKKFVVTIKGSGEKYAIDKWDVVKLLNVGMNGKITNTPVEAFDLSELEALLKTNRWISEADIYFDSQDVMHVLVTEKEPIARVFTTAGTSFYMDSSGVQMPLLDKVSIRLPVFTNYPAVKTASAKDSFLLANVKMLATYINKNPFWSSQIAQVDITEQNTFEAVPTVGNHIIKLGTAENLEDKMHKLFLFYKKVVSKVGFDKYSIIDVQFQNQVVATNKGPVTSVDVLQLQRNIEALLQKNSLNSNGSGYHTAGIAGDTAMATVDSNYRKPIIITAEKYTGNKKSNVAEPKKKISVVKPKVKSAPAKTNKKKVSTTKPKAVMPKLKGAVR